MKLNINPKELLALHNMLYERFEATMTAYDKPAADSGDANLRQLYGRVKAVVLASLSNKAVDADDLFNSWEMGQKTRIAKMQEELDHIKKESIDSVKKFDSYTREMIKKSTQEILSADDVEDNKDYPKKAPKPSWPRGQKFHGTKR